jgi:hypothetical protein
MHVMAVRGIFEHRLKEILVTRDFQFLAGFVKYVDKICAWRDLDFGSAEVRGHNLHVGRHVDFSRKVTVMLDSVTDGENRNVMVRRTDFNMGSVCAPSGELHVLGVMFGGVASRTLDFRLTE